MNELIPAQDLENFLKPRKQETMFHFGYRVYKSLQENKIVWFEKSYLTFLLVHMQEVNDSTKIKILLQVNLSIIKIMII